MRTLKNIAIGFLAVIAAFEAGLIVSYGFVMRAINEMPIRRRVNYRDYYGRRESGDE